MPDLKERLVESSQAAVQSQQSEQSRCQCAKWRPAWRGGSLRDLWGFPKDHLVWEMLSELRACVGPCHVHSGNGQVRGRNSCRCGSLVLKNCEFWWQALEKHLKPGMAFSLEAMKCWLEDVVQQIVRVEAMAGWKDRIALYRTVDRGLARGNQVLTTVLMGLKWEARVSQKGGAKLSGTVATQAKQLREVVNRFRARVMLSRAVDVSMACQVHGFRPRKCEKVQAERWVNRLQMMTEVLQGTERSNTGQRLCRSCVQTEWVRDGSARGWLYLIDFPGRYGFYVGSTCRRGKGVRPPPKQDPGKRWQEHIAASFRVQHAGGTSGNQIPMYRKLSAQPLNILQGVYVPLLGLATLPIIRGEPTAPVVRQIRNAERILQVAWKPGYVSPWCAPRVIRGVTMARQGHRLVGPRQDFVQPSPTSRMQEDKTAGKGAMALLRRDDGALWQPHTDYHSQFEPGRVSFAEDRWTKDACADMVVRLVSHGKSAAAMYPVLRRMPDRCVRQVLTTALQMGGTNLEEGVWEHVRRAGCRTRKIPRLRVLDLEADGWSMRRLLEPWLEATRLSQQVAVVRWKRVDPRVLRYYVSTELEWQNKAASKGSEEVRCRCVDLRATLGPWARFLQAATETGGHLWCKWSDLVKARPTQPEDSPAMQAPWETWRNDAAAAVAMSAEEDLPISWLTPVRPSRGAVIEHACQTIAQLVLTCWGFNRRSISKGTYSSLVGVVRKVYYNQPQEESDGRGQGISSTLAKTCPVRRFHVTTLDKRPADCRIACPKLAVQEIERDLRKYFQPVARCDSLVAEKAVADWETEFCSLLEHENIEGAVLAETDFQTVRALPKGKSPGAKSRLVVGCHRLATAKIHKWATRERGGGDCGHVQAEWPRPSGV